MSQAPIPPPTLARLTPLVGAALCLLATLAGCPERYIVGAEHDGGEPAHDADAASAAGGTRLRFDPPEVESVRGMLVCVTMILDHPDGTSEVIRDTQLSSLMGNSGPTDAQFGEHGYLCPDALSVEPRSPTAEPYSAPITVGTRDGNFYPGRLPIQLLPYQFELEGPDLTAPLGQVVPIEPVVTFHDESFNPVSWSNPHARFLPGAFTVEIEDLSVARVEPGDSLGIRGIRQGQTRYSFRYGTENSPAASPAATIVVP
jgi:hypothetical protein